MEKKAEKKEKKEKKTNALFDLINALFTNREYVYNITQETAKQSLFMVLRRIAIKYPVEANVFNDNKVNALDVIKFWSDYLYSGYAPRWVYASGANKSKASKSKISQEDIKTYKRHYGINDKDFDDCMRFFPDDTIKEIDEICEFYKKVNQKNNENQTFDY